MQAQEAISLIQNGIRSHSTHQIWADLGCGTGTFTLALAALLPPPGVIYAVDKEEAALRQIPTQHNNIVIEKRVDDFIQAELTFTNLNGILIANALHYVRDKVALINKLSSYLHETGCFLIVEYETDRANPWVPYPIRFQALQALFLETGFQYIEKLGEMPSRYQGKMYSALIQK